MDKEPETYEELIRKKRCIDLLNDYELSKEELEKIYNFLKDNPKGTITGNDTTLSLKKWGQDPEVINAKCINSSIDGVKVSDSRYVIIPHYVPSSSGGYSSGGSSSNNNNHNNNNNNNNR